MESKYENLPVYKAAFDLTVYFENIVKGFSRYNKYTVGSDLRNISREILLLVARANTKKDRTECLQTAILKLEDLKILIRLCRQTGAFTSSKSFEFSSRSVVNILQQCEGWLRVQNSTEKVPGKRVQM